MLALLRQLEDEGFEIDVAEPNVLRIRPVGRVTPELRADLQRLKLDLVMFIRICDPGVQERRWAFAEQLARAPSDVPVPRLAFREAPYVSGRCHSCGEVLEGPRWGRCWRCALAWPARVPGCRFRPDLAVAIDGAKVCACVLHLRRVAPSGLAGAPAASRRDHRRLRHGGHVAAIVLPVGRNRDVSAGSHQRVTVTEGRSE